MDLGLGRKIATVMRLAHTVVAGNAYLADYARRIPGFTYATCVADPQTTHPQQGYVTQHMPPQVLHAGNVDVYLCGPPPMVEAVSQYIREQGIAPKNFYYEKFAASAA